jgi:molecular chaperone HtpG
MSEKHQFQAEIQQLLDIVIHSLYTDREIFIRELVSNAADACERLRFLQTASQPVFQPETALGIAIKVDEAAGTVTITDTGIGMSQAELVENLGTIAHSGTRAFLKSLEEGKKPDAALIGQFGVGFYSAFMVATQVVVSTRSYRPEDQGWLWTSTGGGGYEIEAAADLPRGTAIVLHLKPENKEFARPGQLETLIKRYSRFIQFPIELDGKRLNTMQAIWSRNKSEIKEEEYTEFYQYLGHDQEKPLFRLHFTADAPLAIQSLLFVPSRNWESTGMMRIESEVSLYCKRVLIQDRPKELFPEWLRFLKGVVDSEDMPLNISRETMQDTSLMQKLNKVLTGRFLKFLAEQAEANPETYEKFYKEYQRFLKEGVVSDYTHKDQLGKLLRYESSTLDQGKTTSLHDYVTRMGSDQNEIFYLLAPSREAAESSPYFEVFQQKKVEVLFLQDPWDEFVMEHLHNFEGKSLKAAEKSSLVLEKPATEQSLSDEDAAALSKWLKEALGERVNDVRSSRRLVDSPVIVVDQDQMMTASMRRIMKAMNKDRESAMPESKTDLEINPAHGIIRQLNQLRQTDAGLATLVAGQLFDNACVAAGLLEDPRQMVKRLNVLLEKVLTRPANG